MLKNLFKIGEEEEFFLFAIWRFYWAKKNTLPANSVFGKLLGRLYFYKRLNTYSGSRLTDDDTVIGPFSFGKSSGYIGFSINLKSANLDNEREHCVLTIHMFNIVSQIRLPNIIKPVAVKTQANWDEATIERMGRNWYWSYYTREYGFSFSEGGFFQIHYGQQNDTGLHEEVVTKSWSCFLPWTQWRHVSHSLIDEYGFIFYNQTDSQENKHVDFYEMKKKCPSVSFLIEDYDGEKIVAKTILEERIWLKGEGWCKWLSNFVEPMRKNYLDIEFASEVGKSKGSWKGGLIGHSIETFPSEKHEEAFKRYCELEHSSKEGKYKIKFIRRLENSVFSLIPNNQT